jgi:hypothetical protein
MGQIVLGPMYFDECTINKSNITLELQELCTQDPLLFNSRPLGLVNNGGIHTRCNKNAIIIYCTFVPIPHECIILCDIVLFHGKDEVQQTLFRGQFGWLTRTVMCLPNGPCMTNDGWHNNLCQLLKLIQSELMRVLNKTP